MCQQAPIDNLDYLAFDLYWTGANVDRILELTPTEIEVLIKHHWGLLKGTQEEIDDKWEVKTSAIISRDK